jgi:hypothetical protein
MDIESVIQDPLCQEMQFLFTGRPPAGGTDCRGEEICSPVVLKNLRDALSTPEATPHLQLPILQKKIIIQCVQS